MIPESEPVPNPTWFNELETRQQDQVRFSRLYARDFHHGADGHNNMMIIARLAEKLDEYEERLLKELNR